MLATILSIVDRFALSIMIDPIRRDLGLSDGQIGLLSGIAFGLFYACMGLPMGMLADRWSNKGTILLGVGVWSAATAFCGLSRNFGELLLARIGVGAGEAGLAPAAFSIIHALFPPAKLGRALSVLQMGALAGSSISIMVVGLIFSRLDAVGPIRFLPGLVLQPWQSTFVAIALPGAAILLLIGLIPEPQRTHRKTGAQARLLDGLKEKGGLYFCLFFGMGGILVVSYGMLSWVPAILQREFAMPLGEAALHYGMIVLVTGLAGLLLGGIVTDRLYRAGHPLAHAGVPLVATIVSIPLAVAVMFVRDGTGLLAVVALLHFFVALPIGVVPALVQIEAPDATRARVSALYVLVINVAGLGVGPVAIGFLSQFLGPQPEMLRRALGLVSLVAALASLLLLVTLSRLLIRRRADQGQKSFPPTRSA
jgi:MFS family permease